jgi:hypothetical protein
MVLWDLCNTVILYIEEHGIIRLMMINITVISKLTVDMIDDVIGVNGEDKCV